MGPNATNTLITRLRGVRLRQDVRKMVAILFPFILLRKTTLFINSASVLGKTSGSGLMTRMQTGRGSGQTPPSGHLQTGLA